MDCITGFYAQMKRIMPVPDKAHLLGPVFPRHEFVSLIVYLSQQYYLNNPFIPMQQSFPFKIAKACNKKAVLVLFFTHA